MKINPFNHNPVNPYKKQQAKIDQANHQKNNMTDKLEISNRAKEMQNNNRISAERQEKVDALKEQVQNGTYEPNAKKTAESIAKYFNRF